MPSNRTNSYILIFSILGLLQVSETKTDLFFSPSWLSPAIKYGACLSGMYIAGQVSWHHIQRFYTNMNQNSITLFIQSDQPIPNDVIDKCTNEFLKEIYTAYNDQLKTDPQQLEPIKKIIREHHALI